MLNWNQSVITKIDKISEQTDLFKVKILSETDFDFIPGQFITFDLPIHEKKNKRLRSYSIASGPNKSKVIELIIGKVPDGAASNFLFNRTLCNIGTELPFRGPLGVFQLPKDLNQHHIFICTGTGVAPFRSMMHHIKENNIPFKSIDLIFGTRTRADVIYREEFEQLADSLPGFNYHLCLSREEYKGYQGYVHKVYQKIAAGYEQKSIQFMFCGWRDMIDQARKELSDLNYTKDQIHFELYG